MEITTMLAFAFGLFLLYIIGILLVIPIRIIIKLIANGILGGLLLLVINLLGKLIGIHIAINPLTAIIVGTLGIPGIILLVIMQNIL